MNLVFLGVLELPMLLVIALILLVLAGKNEPDAERERPAALYLSFMTLTGVLLLFGATFFTVHGLMELTDTTPTGSSYGTTSRSLTVSGDNTFLPPGQAKRPQLYQKFEGGPTVNHDDDVSQVVGGLIAAAVALALLWFHVPKLQQAADDSVGPGARIFSRLLYVVAGAAVLTGLAAAASALYSVYGMIAPDTAGAGQTTDALRALISVAALGAVAAYVFRTAWARAEDLAAVAHTTTVEVEAATPVKKAARVRKAAPPSE